MTSGAENNIQDDAIRNYDILCSCTGALITAALPIKK
jgi:hypothetical protein